MDVVRLAGSIGAEIRGVGVGRSARPDVVAAIRAALLEHKVIFLREQELDYATQVAFGQCLGVLTPGHPIYGAPAEKPYLRSFDSREKTRANHWHADLTFLEAPPAIALLHAKVIPPVGGDTIWANTITAYASLPPEVRCVADQIRIVHSNDSDYTDATVAARREYTRTLFEAEHPAVHVHPETGEHGLYVGGFARRVVGLGPQASRDLIRLLQECVIVPEQTCRWNWRVGDLAIWDNRATQHYAVYDYGNELRLMERVTVAGEPLVGLDGRRSSAPADDV